MSFKLLFGFFSGISGSPQVKLDAMVMLLRKAGVGEVSKYRSEAVAKVFETCFSMENT